MNDVREMLGIPKTPETNRELFSSLHSIFGFTTFRSGQEEIVQAILEKRDVFAVMPTGGGKSLCYQLPACMLPGTCIVFSPLISLMKDQVDNAKINGIAAEYLNSSLPFPEQRRVLESLHRGQLKLLYIAPERLFLQNFMERFIRIPVSFFAIDEAHCISDWGHDFRPDYLQLSTLSRSFPSTPIAAFTATATLPVQNDIIQKLNLRSPHTLRASFNRPNLFYEVIPKSNTLKQISEFIGKRMEQSGIIYRTTRKSVEETAEYLKGRGINALPYHAGLEDNVRKRNQEQFNDDTVPVIVATIAFGMGIDKSNVRYVLHGDLPKNMEHYYQETGRAGRDGSPAHCILLFGRGDIPKIRSFIEEVADAAEKARLNTALQRIVSYSSTNACRRKQILEYFGELYPESNCRTCDVCTNTVETVDATTEAQMLLSTVYRTGNRFGIMHVIDVLCGADTQRVHSNNHDKLKCYGVGKHKNRVFWRQLTDSLLAHQCLVQSSGQYPVIQLGPEAKPVLVGLKKIELLKTVENYKEKNSPRDNEQHQDYDQTLFSLLRNLRLKLARERLVPPYVIFTDKTLMEMALLRPQTKTELLSVTGVGDRKLEQYGDAFLSVISTYIKEKESQNSSQITKKSDNDKTFFHKDISQSPTMITTLSLLKEGKTLSEIAKHRNLEESTIVTHIEKLVLQGQPIDVALYITPEKLRLIKELFLKHKTTRLKLIVEASNNSITYDEVRLARSRLIREGVIESHEIDESPSVDNK